MKPNDRLLHMLIALLLAPTALAGVANRSCDLLKPADVNRVFQTRLGEGLLTQSEEGRHYCEYRAPDETMMLVGFADRNGRAMLTKHKEALADNPGRVESIPGLGDEAVLQVNSAGGGSVGVRRGDVFFVIMIASNKRLPVKDGMIQLARTALARL